MSELLSTDKFFEHIWITYIVLRIYFYEKQILCPNNRQDFGQKIWIWMSTGLIFMKNCNSSDIKLHFIYIVTLITFSAFQNGYIFFNSIIFLK